MTNSGFFDRGDSHAGTVAPTVGSSSITNWRMTTFGATIFLSDAPQAEGYNLRKMRRASGGPPVARQVVTQACKRQILVACTAATQKSGTVEPTVASLSITNWRMIAFSALPLRCPSDGGLEATQNDSPCV